MSLIQIIYDDEASPNEEKPNITSMLLDGSNGETVDEELNVNPITESDLSESNNNKSGEALGSNNVSVEWSNRETNFLLKKYNKYILITGRRKKFRTKRELWQRVAQDMKNELKVTKSGFQCENRYKTILRKWKKQAGKNTNQEKEPTSVNTSKSDFFQEQVNSSTVELETQDNKKKDLSEVLWEIFKKQEENKERRHKEKMELIKSLLQNYG